MRCGSWKWKVVWVRWSWWCEWQSRVLRWMETFTSSPAGDALLMGVRARCCDPAGARWPGRRRRCWFGRLSEGECDSAWINLPHQALAALVPAG